MGMPRPTNSSSLVTKSVCSLLYSLVSMCREFKSILAYSPLHNVGRAVRFVLHPNPQRCSTNIQDAAYPSMLLCTADHDDRVVPLHSFKLAAELQHRIGSRHSQRAPLLIRIDRKAGHGAGKPLEKTIQEYAEIFGFIAHSLNAEFAP